MAATASTATPTPLPHFTEREASVLALYDRLRQLQLELALLTSQRSHGVIETSASRRAENDLAVDEARLLEARATLDLRDSVVENVVTLQPILNAVHHATHASPLERDLLPYTEQRDATATKVASLCADLDSAWGRLAELETESLRATQRNMELASEVLRLAAGTNDKTPSQLEGGRLEMELAGHEAEMKSNRRRWRIMKGAASAIVAGSGIDWVRDERLRDLVLDLPD
ncbi:uncharacterized protein THITE_2113209 [Thermothielavioides terrestris NRRL 8126]|uniref:Centromere protein H C-terminal domain-containing protein n=1 Tax=Thermothielavioides terrestris (strain ATCC 38088 / NRRL 8126) TaxID=578455 RepID=G2R207_THETT|nr:uncharacterized protein THITE_2113209 [Thermothielavioides terrestris NRRL 8126]AEO65788.1 hypothetical protein THITE_2113209 [Thermothielavioides terrestris NRRL 8126]